MIAAILTYINVKHHKNFILGKLSNLFISLGGMVIGSCIGTVLKAKILGFPVTFNAIWFAIVFGVFITMMFFFYYSFKDSEKENSTLKIKNTEAEMHALKNQMQPHFLFNSLNSLLQLVETKSDLAPEMTMLLSDLYREILESSKKSLVPLGAELSIVNKYLTLEKFRFGDRLHYKISKPQNFERIFLPPLILQTLVENSIKHGITTLTKGGSIEVAIDALDDGYEVHVTNTGGLKELKKPTGMGLANSRSRLDLLYGEKNNFRINKIEDSVKVSFWISGDQHVEL